MSNFTNQIKIIFLKNLNHALEINFLNFILDENIIFLIYLKICMYIV